MEVMCIPETMLICLTRMNIYPERAVKNLYIIFWKNREREDICNV